MFVLERIALPGWMLHAAQQGPPQAMLWGITNPEVLSEPISVYLQFFFRLHSTPEIWGEKVSQPNQISHLVNATDWFLKQLRPLGIGQDRYGSVPI